MPPRISLAHQFEQQRGETWGLAFSPDGKRLVSSDGMALYLWRLNEHGCWEYERSLAFQNATHPLFAPNNQQIAFRDKDTLLRLISLDDGKVVATLSCPAATDFAFSPDQRWLATGDTVRNLLLWDLSTYQSLLIPVRFPRIGYDSQAQEMMQTDETIRSFCFTPDGERLALLADSEDGYLHLCYFDPTDKVLMRQKTFPHGSMDLAISPNGKMLAVIVSNQKKRYAYRQDILVYDLDSRRLLHIFPQVTDEGYNMLAFSPDSHYLTSCKTDGWVDIFSLNSFDLVADFAAHPGLATHAAEPIGGLDWSKTGFIATGGASNFKKDWMKTDYTIKIWRVED